MKKIINYIFIGILIFSLYKLSSKYYLDKRDVEAYDNIRNMAAINDNNKHKTQDEKVSKEEVKLKEINNDFQFWLNINGTNINYPVVKGEDNEFYLKHNFYKKQSNAGTLFIDSDNDLNKDKNIIIYGHNMKNDTMFAQLNKFRDKKFFDNNSYIDIFKDGDNIRYKIISVKSVEDAHKYIKRSFNSNKEYKSYMDMLKENSIIYRNPHLESEYDIITLVTCSYEEKDSRLIVNAVKMD